MKKILLPALLLATTPLAYGQKTEVSGHLNSGFFAFRGASATAESDILVSDVVGFPNYTANPYGNQWGWSYGGAAQLQRVTRGQTLFGVQAGYEQLRSRVKINQVQGFVFSAEATGHVNLNNHFLNAHSFVGHRFSCHGLDVDVSAGPEVGYLLKTNEKGKATDARGYEYAINGARSRTHTLDARLRGNVTLYYKQAGLSTGYSYGLTNYREGYVGGTSDLFTQMWRLGVVYRLN